MVSALIEKELHEQLEQLPDAKQREVLAFARSLAEQRLQGVSGKSLLRFAGCMNPETARQMMEAVEAGCENIDADSW